MNLSLSAALNASMEQHLPQCLQWLECMVGINSFSANAAGVNALGQRTEECFADLGFTAQRVDTKDPAQGMHLFLRRPGRTDGKRLILVTHLDTVYPPEEEQRNNFRWQPAPAEGRIYGPGTVDIKGGTALIWLLLMGLRDVLPEVFETTEWIIAADATEEVIGHEFADAVSDLWPSGAHAVLVFEGGAIDGDDFLVVTGRKGRREYDLHASGRGAHAGSKHHEGINAVAMLSQALAGIHQLTDYAAQLTVNVATMHGGTVLNRVPHEATAELEMRAYAPELLEAAGQQVQRICQKAAQEFGGDIRVHLRGESPAWPEDQRNLALAKHWQTAAAGLGKRIRLTQRGGLSDANYLCHLGPTLDGLGPYGDNAHCSERSPDGSKVPEWVAPWSFVPKATLNALAIAQLLAAPSDH
jgi:glutamate carboxypeptidase